MNDNHTRCDHWSKSGQYRSPNLFLRRRPVDLLKEGPGGGDDFAIAGVIHRQISHHPRRQCRMLAADMGGQFGSRGGGAGDQNFPKIRQAGRDRVVIGRVSMRMLAAR